jgi:hypothetical protein
MDDCKELTMEPSPQTLTGAGASEKAESDEVTEGRQFYHGRLLDELPGAAFAAVTMIWFVSAISRLVF